MSQTQTNRTMMNGQAATTRSDPEVEGRRSRRPFSKAYKLRILGEAEQGRQAGEVGALLRREGL